MASLEQARKRLAQRYRSRLAQRADAMSELVRSLDEGDPDAEGALRRHVHQLRGSGASFGLDEVTQRAAAVEEADDGSFRDEVVGLIELIHSLRPDAPTSEPEGAGPDSQLGGRAAVEASFARYRGQSQDGAAKAAIAAVDLDALRVFNERFGHDTGDRLLDAFGKLLERCLGPSDLVCRWGGAEFVVVFPETSSQGAVVVLAAAQSELRGIEVEGLTPGSAGLTMSSGIVEIRAHETLAEAVTRAEAMLDMAKAGGRDLVLDSAPEPQTSARVLVVEDDLDLAADLRTVLEHAGFAVVHAATVADALERSSQGTYELALLDKDLPDGDGIALLERLRSRTAWASRPIVMLTSAGRDEDVEAAFDAGANDYVQKPYRARQLVARLRRLVQL